ncbi:MAG: radical SAM protein [Pseudomonadota bacterium]|nr:radical SAM protein [Pseudomonadota bacterium]
MCNLNCSYCYEYNMGNTSWKFKPKKLSLETFGKLCERIKEQFSNIKHKNDIHMSFHGGEPCLRSPDFFEKAILLSKSILDNHCNVRFGMQSNGTLLSKAHLEVFKKYNMTVGLSLDGDKEANDRHRLDKKGLSTFNRVMDAIELLSSKEYESLFGGILCVLDINNSPQKMYDFFSNLNIKTLDILEPEGNHTNLPPNKKDFYDTSYADWFIEFFDIWFNSKNQFYIRRFEEIIEMLIGGQGSVEYFGTAPVNLITIATDGDYEAVDQMKSVYDGAEKLNLNVFNHSLNEVKQKNLIKSRLDTETVLSDICKTCKYVSSCGGGYFPHRYGENKNYKNPSIYCEDYKKLFSHIEKKINEA